MKYSFMTFSCPDLNFEEVINLAVKYGYDGIELRIEANHAHGAEPDTPIEELHRMRDFAKNRGVEVACIATSCQFAKLELSEKTLEDAKRAVDMAREIGCPAIRVFAGAPMQEETLEKMAETLIKLSDYIKTTDVIVCMETHDYSSDIYLVEKLMKLVNRENIAVNWDFMHPTLRMGTPIEEVYKVLKPWIRHCHIHDGVLNERRNCVFLPMGTGKVDHNKALELLKKDNYSGYLSGEWINWNEPNYLEKELKSLKDIERSI